MTPFGTSMRTTLSRARRLERQVDLAHHRREPLPGVKSTGRKVTIPFVVVVGFDKSGKVEFERIYWDQASVLVQLGLLNKRGLPITGAEQAARLLDPSLPSNTLITKA
jgi:carboxymethylenebutenolidase